jgi:hypothetical protein
MSRVPGTLELPELRELEIRDVSPELPELRELEIRDVSPELPGSRR